MGQRREVTGRDRRYKSIHFFHAMGRDPLPFLKNDGTGIPFYLIAQASGLGSVVSPENDQPWPGDLAAHKHLVLCKHQLPV